MPIDADVDAGRRSGTCRISGSSWPHDGRRDLHGEPNRTHIWLGYEENPVSLHPGQLRRRPVRADGGRALLEQFGREPHRAPPVDARESSRRKVFRIRGPDNRRNGALSRPQSHARKTVEQRLEHERELHAQQVHQPGRARHRHREHLPGSEGSVNERRTVRRRQAEYLQRVSGGDEPGRRTRVRERVHARLDARHGVAGAERFAAVARDDGRFCPHRTGGGRRRR